MIQAISYEKIILESLKKLTPQQQQEVLYFIEFLQFKEQKKNLSDKQEEVISMLEAAQEFVGCVESGIGDLSLKKKELNKVEKIN
ncbi:MAG: DUF2281 domain-containing protein [Okeania sp. SIO2F4]|uniref:hypothetical protein n=1 Tax=Okeania sp. SIO2F4 TaxID=2607790 RepID=UPI00142B3E83|nr:hypothetical protein [Okeania sp. SIO2F4]NES06364.1 DUF2281 domain-containing protein [Okeania sp. SIO2F4]